MGISGLIPFLQKSSRKVNLSEFKGCTAVVDTYCWLHKGAFSCAEKLARGEPTNGYVVYVMKQVNLLISFGIKPIMVLDGCNLPSKSDVERKRRENRELNRRKAKELLREGKVKEARDCMVKSINITSKMAHDVIEECRKRNVDTIVAPYEADAQLAFFNVNNMADLVITEDSDLVLFGCSKTLLKLDGNGGGILIEREKLHLSMGIPIEKYSFEKFQHMCVLSGCDYLASLHGIGLTKACRFVSVTSNPDIYNSLCRLPSHLKMAHLEVSIEYRKGFVRALNTFNHQLVFDPRDRKLKPLHPYPPESSAENYPYCGPWMDHEDAYQIALGNVDVQSNKVIDTFDPFTYKAPAPKSSGWEKKGDLVTMHDSIWSGNFVGGVRKKVEEVKSEKAFQPMVGKTKIVNYKAPKRKSTEEHTASVQSISDLDLCSFYNGNSVKKPKLSNKTTSETGDNPETGDDLKNYKSPQKDNINSIIESGSISSKPSDKCSPQSSNTKNGNVSSKVSKNSKRKSSDTLMDSIYSLDSSKIANISPTKARMADNPYTTGSNKLNNIPETCPDSSKISNNSRRNSNNISEKFSSIPENFNDSIEKFSNIPENAPDSSKLSKNSNDANDLHINNSHITPRKTSSLTNEEDMEGEKPMKSPVYASKKPRNPFCVKKQSSGETSSTPFSALKNFTARAEVASQQQAKTIVKSRYFNSNPSALEISDRKESKNECTINISINDISPHKKNEASTMSSDSLMTIRNDTAKENLEGLLNNAEKDAPHTVEAELNIQTNDIEDVKLNSDQYSDNVEKGRNSCVDRRNSRSKRSINDSAITITPSKSQCKDVIEYIDEDLPILENEDIPETKSVENEEEFDESSSSHSRLTKVTANSSSRLKSMKIGNISTESAQNSMKIDNIYNEFAQNSMKMDNIYSQYVRNSDDSEYIDDPLPIVVKTPVKSPLKPSFNWGRPPKRTTSIENKVTNVETNINSLDVNLPVTPPDSQEVGKENFGLLKKNTVESPYFKTQSTTPLPIKSQSSNKSGSKRSYCRQPGLSKTPDNRQPSLHMFGFKRDATKNISPSKYGIEMLQTGFP